MPRLSTGFVIAGAYADKVRRVLFAQLRDAIKRGEIDNKTVAVRAGELNRLLYDIIVNRLKLDKGDVVRIRVEYEVTNGDVVWKLESLNVEAFRRVPDDEVEKILKEAVEHYEEILASEVTEEEKSWTEAREREVEREIQRLAKEARTSVSGPRLYTLKDVGVDIVDVVFHGETRRGEAIALLKDNKGDNIGLVSIEPLDVGSRATVIIIPGRRAYRATFTLDQTPDKAKHDTRLLLEKIRNMKYIEISKEDAESFIKDKLEELM